MSGHVRAFAPGSVGNIGPGLDILGLAVAGAGRLVRCRRATDAPGVVVLDPGHPRSPRRPGAQHRGARGAGGPAARRAGRRRRSPFASPRGCRSPAARAAAPPRRSPARWPPMPCSGSACSEQQLLESALAAEACVAGWHLDNIAALAARRHRAGPGCPRRTTTCACPCRRGSGSCWRSPSQRLRTAEGRAVLPADDAARRGAAPGGAGRRRWSRRSRPGDLDAARPRAGRPDRRAGPRAAAARASWRPSGRARGRRARLLDLGQRPDRLRASRRTTRPAQRIAAAMAAAYAGAGVRLLDAGRPSVERRRAPGSSEDRTDGHALAGLRRLRRSSSPSSTGDPRADCGGLLEIAARPARRDGASAAAAVRGALGPARWREPRRACGAIRELVLPGGGRRGRDPPRGEHAPAPPRRRSPTGPGCPRLLLKHEGQNPTGSFKDRGMTVGVTQARRIGARRWPAPPPATPRPSLAAYAAQAGMPALVFVPAGQVALGKLAQSLAYGARTLLVRGDFDACLRLVEEARRRAGRLPAQLDQSVPARGAEDDRARAAAAARLGAARLDRAAGRQPRQHGGVREGAARGAGAGTDRPDCPRIAAVQAAGAAPFARGFAEDFARRHR